MWVWLAPVIIVGLIVAYAIYRMSRDEELEPGGSYGEQFGGKKSEHDT